MKGASPLFSKQSIRKTVTILVIILAVGIPALQLFQSPARAAGPTVSVTIADYSFTPAKINITTGTTVVWSYVNNGKDYHTVSSKPGTNQTQGGTPLLNSGTLDPGQSFSYTFDNPGIYPYQCQFHPALMSGWVNVTGAPVSPPPTQNPTPTTDYTLIAIIGGLIVAVAGTAAIVIIARKRKRSASSIQPQTS